MSRERMTTEQAWQQFSAKVKGFLLYRVSDEQVAEDLLQETFLRIHKKLDSIDDEKRIGAWIFQIARNLVVDFYRSKGNVSASANVDFMSEESSEENNLNEVVMGWLPELIDQLPETHREAVKLYELERMPQQEIANRLNISLSAVKSRIQRGRDKLKAFLFDCCLFEQDRHGNIIDCAKRGLGERDKCGCD